VLIAQVVFLLERGQADRQTRLNALPTSAAMPTWVITKDSRLRKLGIYSLDRRRLRGDLIETFKIITGKEHVDSSKFFQLSDVTSGLRGHSLKLFKPRCSTTTRQNFFSLRVINEWNKLPQEVDAPTINAFKYRLDRHWRDMGVFS